MNFCNIEEVPKELTTNFIDLACGEFLYIKNQKGEIFKQGDSADNSVKSVRIGDTSVDFNTEAITPEQQVQRLILGLRTFKEADFIRYRKCKW